MPEALNEKMDGVFKSILEEAASKNFNIEDFASPEQLEQWRSMGRKAKHKYLNLEKRVLRDVQIGQSIGLDKQDRKIALLDLGAGPAYICLTAKKLGHDALALDIEDPLYEKICAFFGVPRVVHWVTPTEPAPAGIGKFDIVTALAIKFHERGKEYWSFDEWDAFFEKLNKDVLNPGGGVYLSFNFRADHPVNHDNPREMQRWKMYTELHDWMLGRGFLSPIPGIYCSGLVKERYALEPAA